MLPSRVMAVREASLLDVERIVVLAEMKRRAYEPHAPVFQRPANDATEVQRPWLAKLVEDDEVGTFVHEAADGSIDGFIIIATVPAPAVYDPGGLSSLIDDFTVSSPDRWESAGAAHLDVATSWARQRGAVQVVVVSGPHDQPKRALLKSAGLFVASEWFTVPLTP